MKKIAIILPVYYLGGTLQGVKNIIKMFLLGAMHNNDEIQIILSVVKDKYDMEEDFKEFKFYDNFFVRETTWNLYSHDEAMKIMYNVNRKKEWLPYLRYWLPDDGINNFLDCDRWLVISDRCEAPLIPIKEYSVLIYDVIQRHFDLGLGAFFDTNFMDQARQAKNILVTTPQTGDDVHFYYGIKKEKIKLIDTGTDCPKNVGKPTDDLKKGKYILWISNGAKHKNHLKALKALKAYYINHDGQLKVRVIGGYMDVFDVRKKLVSEQPDYVLQCRKYIKENKILMSNIKFNAYVPDDTKNMLLENAAFLLHPAVADNGTFSVIEAAYLGTPSLTNRYPQMEYIEYKYKLNMTFTDFDDTDAAAKAIKECELNCESKRKHLPSREFLESFSPENIADAFYERMQQLL